MQSAVRLVAIFAALTLVANLAAWSAGAHANFETPSQDPRGAQAALAGGDAPSDLPQLSKNGCATYFGGHCQGSLCSDRGVPLPLATHCAVPTLAGVALPASPLQPPSPPPRPQSDR